MANEFLDQISVGDEIRDWQHATKLFVDSLYRLGPKSTALFHVFVELNPTVASMSSENQIELGMLAKTVSLPKFNIQNKVLNAYNRKNIVQERVNYDPITMTFHDDSANVVRNFWHGYYTYYYRDSDHQEPLYHMEHKYKQRQSSAWGYGPGNQAAPNYINSIKIYSLHQKQFSSYTLLRPTITSFSHGEHTQGNYELLEHSMTISYEAVQYAYGPVSNGTVIGFNVVHYDPGPSPLTGLGGGTTSFLGPGGMVETTQDIVRNLGDGNFGAAALGALRSYNNFKNADLKRVAKDELRQIGLNILRGENSRSPVFVPTAASIQEGLAKATKSVPGLVGANPRGTSGTMNSSSVELPPANTGRIDL